MLEFITKTVGKGAMDTLKNVPKLVSEGWEKVKLLKKAVSEAVQAQDKSVWERFSIAWESLSKGYEELDKEAKKAKEDAEQGVDEYLDEIEGAVKTELETARARVESAKDRNNLKKDLEKKEVKQYKSLAGLVRDQEKISDEEFEKQALKLIGKLKGGAKRFNDLPAMDKLGKLKSFDIGITNQHKLKDCVATLKAKSSLNDEQLNFLREHFFSNTDKGDLKQALAKARQGEQGFAGAVKLIHYKDVFKLEKLLS